MLLTQNSCYCCLVRTNIVFLQAWFWLWKVGPPAQMEICAGAAQCNWVSSSSGCSGGLPKPPFRTEVLFPPIVGSVGNWRSQLDCSPGITFSLWLPPHPTLGLLSWAAHIKWRSMPSHFQSSFPSALLPEPLIQSPSQPIPTAKATISSPSVRAQQQMNRLTSSIQINSNTLKKIMLHYPIPFDCS